MPDIAIYHNSRCTKSRNALQILQEKGVPFRIHNYMQEPLSAAEIKRLLRLLDMPAESLIRKNEPIYKEKFRQRSMKEDEWIEAMVLHPQLIERPIVVYGQKAVVARPPEKIGDII
jgi:arsenate reductase